MFTIDRHYLCLMLGHETCNHFSGHYQCLLIGKRNPLTGLNCLDCRNQSAISDHCRYHRVDFRKSGCLRYSLCSGLDVNREVC